MHIAETPCRRPTVLQYAAMLLTPLPLGLGLRYVRAGRHQFLVSFISWVSLLGVGLGVAALITILSVMNGFEGELRSRLLALTAHATLPAAADGSQLAALAARARNQPGVIAAQAFVELQGLVSAGAELAGFTLRGLGAGGAEADATLRSAMREGTLEALLPGSRRIVLGRALAVQLGVAPGDTVTVLLPRTGDGGALEPRIGSFTLAGTFEIGLADHDAVLAVAAFDDVVALAGEQAPAGLRLFFADPFAAPQLASRVAAALGVSGASDWTVEHAAYFRAIRLEKTMMTVILLLIVAVAAFNIVASLVMVVTEKSGDIAILRTLGLSRADVVGAFLVQGTVIGWAGVVAGVGLGVALARNAGAVAAGLERLFGFTIFDAEVFYLTTIPSELRLADVVFVAGAALTLTLLATVYPARRAAATAPAEALRYE
ncbi:MAG: lipoprotein-releasing ABC transporter permease subunit [Gammaproteobacteria bacterium]|nr:MAG: lipoprotein-releasing ABC transporter permease subunit [Gammaproteobacteria bacterium]